MALQATAESRPHDIRTPSPLPFSVHTRFICIAINVESAVPMAAYKDPQATRLSSIRLHLPLLSRPSLPHHPQSSLAKRCRSSDSDSDMETQQFNRAAKKVRHMSMATSFTVLIDPTAGQAPFGIRYSADGAGFRRRRGVAGATPFPSPSYGCIQAGQCG